MSLDAHSTPAASIIDAGVAQGPDPGGEQLSTTPAAVEETRVQDVVDEGSDKPTDEIECAKPGAPQFLHSPPDSNNANKSTASDSELSDLEEEPVLEPAEGPAVATEPADLPGEPKSEEEEEDIGEVLPDDWSGKVPIFRPTWHQFKDFKKFVRQLPLRNL